MNNYINLFETYGNILKNNLLLLKCICLKKIFFKMIFEYDITKQIL